MLSIRYPPTFYLLRRRRRQCLSLSLDRLCYAVNMQDVCYRDVAWLNGDRLVLVAHEGIVTLVSPSEVLQEWNVGGSNENDAIKLSSSTSPIHIGGRSGGSTGSTGTDDTMSEGTTLRMEHSRVTDEIARGRLPRIHLVQKSSVCTSSVVSRDAAGQLLEMPPVKCLGLW